jgi:hypothetical protein
VTLNAAIDNDVLIKGACYSVLADIASLFGGGASVGILSVARFVVKGRIARGAGIQDPESALGAFGTFLASVGELEPTAYEISLATSLEEAAMLASLPVDVGESQLCAMVLSRSIRFLVTGDKRAITSLEALLPAFAELDALRSRVACMEQVIFEVANAIGWSQCRDRVCAEPDVDRALSICFSCRQPAVPDGSSHEGIESYVRDIRRAAPTVLCSSLRLT